MTCLSALQLDRLLRSELTAAETQDAAFHLQSCGRCKNRQAQFEAERSAFLASMPPLPAERVNKHWVQRATRHALWVGPTAMAAALLIFFGVDRMAPQVRSKGSAYAKLYVQHDQQTRHAASGETLYAGDRLQFSYTSTQPTYLAIVSVDGEGRASAYFPEPTGSARLFAAPLPAGQDVPLSVSTLLDDAIGSETLFTVFCPQAFEVDPWLRPLGQRAALQAPAGCEGNVMTFRKLR